MGSTRPVIEAAKNATPVRQGQFGVNQGPIAPKGIEIKKQLPSQEKPN